MFWVVQERPNSSTHYTQLTPGHFVTGHTVAFRLAAKLVDAKLWEDAEQVADALLNGPDPGTQVRLLYAWVLLQRGRPSAALEQLNDVQPANPAEAGKLAHIRQEAERKKAETPYEFA